MSSQVSAMSGRGRTEQWGASWTLSSRRFTVAVRRLGARTGGPRWVWCSRGGHVHQDTGS
jgi:hypothetical protein